MDKNIGIKFIPITKEELKEKFINLIKMCGTEMRTFDFCTSRGYNLKDSTIDKFELVHQYNTDDIRIYYNENENDYEYYDTFDEYELVEFYNAIILYFFDDGYDENDTTVDTFLKTEIWNEYFIEEINKEYFKNTPTSDLFAIVAEQASKETILSVAEGYVGDDNIREFLFACLGFDIE